MDSHAPIYYPLLNAKIRIRIITEIHAFALLAISYLMGNALLVLININGLELAAPRRVK
jgi:hypothetical protein